MKYLLAIYSEERVEEEIPADQQDAYMGKWFQFDEDIRKGVNVLAGHALHPVVSATTVRQRDGDTVTLDGPFAETKEQLGGFYLIDVEDLDQAIKWASKMPNLAYGGAIEVRPIVVFDSE